MIDPDTVFRWSLYLLLALWPLAVYCGARLFGLGRWTAAAAAAVAPLLASTAGIGYETKAYVWVGYGVWTQLWAAWTLPFAWGFTYRALSSLRAAFPAVLFIMVTVALHFETGYLAFVPLVVWPFIVPSDLWRRLGRARRPRRRLAAGVGLGHRALARPVPLGGAQPGAGRHRARERLRRAPDAVVALHRSPLRRRPLARRHRPRRRRHRRVHLALALEHRRPRPRQHLGGHAAHDLRAHDLRRPLPTSCPAAATSSSGASRWACSSPGSCWPASASCSSDDWLSTPSSACSPRNAAAGPSEPAGRGLIAGLCVVALVLVLAPAWSSLDAYDGHNATNIGLQAGSDAQQEPQIDRLLDYVRAHPRGASMPACPPTGARTSRSVRCRSSSTSRARTSTRSATRCGRRRS